MNRGSFLDEGGDSLQILGHCGEERFIIFLPNCSLSQQPVLQTLCLVLESRGRDESRGPGIPVCWGADTPEGQRPTQGK